MVLTALAGRALARFVRGKRVLGVLKGFGLLVAIGVLLLAMVRHHSGGRWAGDLWEHYDRTRFFLGQLPADYRFLGLYSLPARPPFMNAVCAFFLAHVGDGFLLCQLAFPVLSLLVYLPLVQLTRFLGPRSGDSLGRLTAFLALSPVLWQNATFPWTKLFCSFYVLLGLALYVRGWQKNDARRVAGAFVSLAAGVLVHYSAAVYGVILSLHYGSLLLRKARPWREAEIAVLLSALLMASWLGWSIATFGARTTFGANSTVTDSSKLRMADNLAKMGLNLFCSIVPHPIHRGMGAFLEWFWQPSELGLWRDYWFLMVQTTVVLMMGSVAGVTVVCLLVRDWVRGGQSCRPVRPFWASLVLGCLVLGVAVHGELDRFGVGHICLQPLALLGIAYLAARFPALPAGVRSLLIVGAAVDWTLGVLLHFHVLSCAGPFPGPGSWVLSPRLPSNQAVRNAMYKSAKKFVYVGDLLGELSGVLEVVVFAAGVALVCWLLRQAGPSRFAARASGLAAAALLAGMYLWCGEDRMRKTVVVRLRDRAEVVERVKEALPKPQICLVFQGIPEVLAELQSATGFSRESACGGFGDVRGGGLGTGPRLLHRRSLARPYRYEGTLLFAPDQQCPQGGDARGVGSRERATVPGDAAHWCVLSALLLAHGHPHAAASALARATSLSGDPLQSCEATGDALMKIGSPDLVVRLYRMGLACADGLPPSPGTHDAARRLTAKLRRLENPARQRR